MSTEEKKGLKSKYDEIRVPEGLFDIKKILEGVERVESIKGYGIAGICNMLENTVMVGIKDNDICFIIPEVLNHTYLVMNREKFKKWYLSELRDFERWAEEQFSEYQKQIKED